MTKPTKPTQPTMATKPTMATRPPEPITPARPAGPAGPTTPPRAASRPDVVEMDAMDVREWEQDQRTPEASSANLAALVKESAKAPDPIAPDGPRKASLVDRARDTTRALTARPAMPRPTTRALTPRPAMPVATARTSASSAKPGPVGSAKPGPVLRSPPAPEPQVPSSSRPLSGRRVAVARASSALTSDDDKLASLIVEETTPIGPRPEPDDAGHGRPDPLPVATHGEPGAGPLSPPPSQIDPSLPPSPLAVPDEAALPRPELPEAPATTLAPAAPAPRARASSRRRRWWIGGAAGVPALGLTLALLGGGKPEAVATVVKANDPPQVSAETTRGAAPAPGAAAPGTPAPDPSVAPPPPGPGPEATPKPGAAATRSSPRPAKQLGGKQLVVEYTGRENETAAPGLVAQTAEDPAIGRARSAYFSGNQKLFAGDAEGAIRAYHQALAAYPGYVGGYRGLGLAYAQLGDNPKALDAFKTYVSTVPNAKDIALIKKRIARLLGR